MADLLVSCCNLNGGLFRVDTECGAVERLRDGDLRGIAIAGPRIFVGEVFGLLELDRSFTELRRLDLPGADVHGAFVKDDRLYVCMTAWNRISVRDVSSLEPVGEIVIPGTVAKGSDHNHISSVWVDDRVLFVSVHTWASSTPERPGAILALDRQGTRVLERRSNLNRVEPHSVVKAGKDLYYCDSGERAFCRNEERVGRVRGYPRGLAVDAVNYYVGQSRFRYGPEIPQPCGVVVVRRDDGERSFIPLPASEVFDVALLG